MLGKNMCRSNLCNIRGRREVLLINRSIAKFLSKCKVILRCRLYLNIQANLGEVFEWIKEEISCHLPNGYKVLVKLIDILPNALGSPVRPFLLLMVNINVCMVAHRDAKDFKLCLVLAVGEFTGGGLVMREQRLVMELRNGDFVIFRRASLIMYTDAKATPASRAKAAPAFRAKATPTSSLSAKGGKNAVKGPGLTVGEEKLLKDLAQKKKVAEDAAEAKKKHAADCLLEEAEEDKERSDKDLEEEVVDEVDEEEKEFAREETVIGLKKEDEKFNKHFSITSIPKSKVKLSNLNSPCTKCIAISAYKAMCLYVATVNSFSSALNREELCWDLLVSSTRDNETWKAASQLRGEFIAKARISVPSTCGIGELKHEELEKMRFIY
ncbi:uncharacterized protein HD556DRAFT_1314887 [Suillus plorans]|uniref:Uncharacterized protein n=1 Tax=Suillus plorans TaxID=116603 RepID=A0A9P7A928_9AGAM|nr:uncharacterized protein HD556DRAFT_1314887 [Suillus plorans]KAG1784674.1 hypothetical protein HD556DRAFT_1314887 [Suillus plorans]